MDIVVVAADFVESFICILVHFLNFSSDVSICFRVMVDTSSRELKHALNLCQIIASHRVFDRVEILHHVFHVVFGLIDTFQKSVLFAH